MATFFIDRPVFAWVISIIIMLAGILAILTLPIEQYPRIAPPSVSIATSYPGASAETLENSVTQVLEQQLTGIDHLRYFASSSDATGNLSITITFEPEADPDTAQVQVQNKLQAALPLLPQEVQRQGVIVTKANSAFLMVIGFISTDGSMDEYALGDYVNSTLIDPLSRVQGVGNVNSFAQSYAMRIWLDPGKLTNYGLTTTEITQAVTVQNADVSAGQLGGNPAVKGQEINATITAQSRLKTVEDFENILLRVNQNGSQVRLRDVARVELGVQNYDFVARYNAKPAAGVAITLATGANALDAASAVRAKMKELSRFMPAGMEAVYPYDTTPFVKISIEGVVYTLLEAVALVFLVMYLFLQNFRATLIPTIAVPVVLLGTFAILLAFGFTINTLSMFAMVLAIGLLVDDAIVVVENVERIMSEEGLSPREATRKSMEQISGALVGIALVLSAVFVPMAFFSGSTGAIYRQFSITIVSAMGLSVLVAVVLTPALCATLLKPVAKGHHEADTGFFGWFNRMFNRGRASYHAGASHVIRRSRLYLGVYAVLLAALAFMFLRIPTAFLPDEDQGLMFVMINTPPGATTQRTMESVLKVEDYFLTTEKPYVDGLFTVAGFSFAGNGQNSAIGFVKLKDWADRPEGNSVFDITGRAMGAFSQIKDAMAFAFAPPAVNELGNATGFDVQLVDQGGLGREALNAAAGQLFGMVAQEKTLQGVRPNEMEPVPQYKIDVDNEKASVLGLSLADINATLQTAWGSAYVNDFIDKGRIKRVYIQGDKEFRMKPEDVDRWYVRNKDGGMVPFSSFSSAEWSYGSPKLSRFGGLPSYNIQGSPAPGVSSGDAMATLEGMMRKLPEGIGYEWTGLSYEERSAGQQTPLLYSLSLLIVFLCLAALYESWSVPFSVMLVVPLGIIGAVAATLIKGMSNDVYFQVGLLTTIGLAAKNAILIVEFAKKLYEEEGMSLYDAAMKAAEQRLRPILMTSIAFVLGVTPLAIASGAGSASQNAIGVGVMGGMLAATFLAIFFVPMFFVVINSWAQKRRRPANEAAVYHEQ